MTLSAELQRVLHAVQNGDMSLSTALPLLAQWAGVAQTAEVAVDLDRLHRCGYPEVVYSSGKTTNAILDVFRTQHAAQQPSLATRVSPEQAQAVLAELPEVVYHPLARTLRWGQMAPVATPASVAVVTAGTSDRPVGEEAAETARWMGCDVEVVWDVGVAGPQRLPLHLPRLVKAHALVVVAGMEAALPSVVAGYVRCPVIAVPTSQGYGAHFGGVSALLGVLNSCASNVTVVNIDAGFKGGYVAGLIARRTPE